MVTECCTVCDLIVQKLCNCGKYKTDLYSSGAVPSIWKLQSIVVIPARPGPFPKGDQESFKRRNLTKHMQMRQNRSKSGKHLRQQVCCKKKTTTTTLKRLKLWPRNSTWVNGLKWGQYAWAGPMCNTQTVIYAICSKQVNKWRPLPLFSPANLRQHSHSKALT